MLWRLLRSARICLSGRSSFERCLGYLKKMLERFRHVDKTWGSLECEVGCFEC